MSQTLSPKVYLGNTWPMTAPPPPSAAKVQAALHEATIHYQAGRLAEAEKICRRILLEYPTNPETNMSLAIVLKDLSVVR